MAALVPIGAILSLLGVAGLVWCILIAVRARRSGDPEEVVRAKLQRAVALNMGALALSAFGLMFVVIGILLG